MSRLIKLHDIDEFAEVIKIPTAAIKPTILGNIKTLDEKEEIELFLREIIHDFNETPHGPTEIADILTTHLIVRGDKKSAAFILKGKSFKKVTSDTIARQLLKLRQIPDLGLIVLCCVGNIHDDAQRDFFQIACDLKSDYLLIDNVDLSRLLIAYELICPHDGYPYNERGICKNNHFQDEGITLKYQVKEDIEYKIYTQRDISHPGAKRYSAIILTDKHYSRELLRVIVKDATEKLKESNYYRNDRVKQIWGETNAHVIWLYVAYNLDDISNTNWICRTCWIDDNLDDSMKPMPLSADEKCHTIDLQWNAQYHAMKNFYSENSASKEALLGVLVPILDGTLNYANLAIELFQKYQHKSLSENEFIQQMQSMKSIIDDLHDRSGNIPFPPDDCKDYDNAFQGLIGTVYNMSLFYEEDGLKTWPQKNRNWLMADTIIRYQKDLSKLMFEQDKIHSS